MSTIIEFEINKKNVYIRGTGEALDNLIEALDRAIDTGESSYALISTDGVAEVIIERND